MNKKTDQITKKITIQTRKQQNMILKELITFFQRIYNSKIFHKIKNTSKQMIILDIQ